MSFFLFVAVRNLRLNVIEEDAFELQGYWGIQLGVQTLLTIVVTHHPL